MYTISVYFYIVCYTIIHLFLFKINKVIKWMIYVSLIVNEKGARIGFNLISSGRGICYSKYQLR